MAKEKENIQEKPETTNPTVEEEIAAATEAVEKPKKRNTKSNAEEKVLLEIPISEAEQDDWFCCINGKTFVVQRGEQVLVPKFVKEVYDNQVRMQQLSIMRSRALQQKLQDKEKLAFS